MTKLTLPTVTLCAATSVNVGATIAALRHCMQQIDFAEALLFTDRAVHDLPGDIQLVRIRPLNSGRAYSEFVLRDLAKLMRTDHCLLVQWDGFVLDPRQWDEQFLKFDYIGAPWPQFDDGFDVGNGGFSLRSRRLLNACADSRFKVSHPEDVAIGRINRDYLEKEHGVRVADRGTAARFAFERAIGRGPTFGFHGIFNMAGALGVPEFWNVYRSLDDRSTIVADYRLLVRQVRNGRGGLMRAARLTFDTGRELLRF